MCRYAVCVVLLVAGCSAEKEQHPKSAAPPAAAEENQPAPTRPVAEPSAAEPGTRRWRLAGGTEKEWPACADRWTLQRFWQFYTARDDQGGREMIESQKVFFVKGGTEVRLIGPGPEVSEVRILEGERRGHLVWVPSLLLEKVP